MRYYVNDNGEYTEVSNESPKGFKGILFVAREGRQVANVIELYETALSTEQIKALTFVDIGDIPKAWAEAFGIEVDEVEEEVDDQPPEEVPWQDLMAMGPFAVLLPWSFVAIFAAVFWLLDRMFNG